MDIVFVEVEFLSNLPIRKVETHKIQTQNPNVKGLVMTHKDGVGQIVKATVARLAQVALAFGLGVIAPFLGDLRAVAMGTLHAFWPAQLADGGETFGIIDERLNGYHSASIAHRLS